MQCIRLGAVVSWARLGGMVAGMVIERKEGESDRGHHGERSQRVHRGKERSDYGQQADRGREL